jgi:S-disulfanyl-L-cysteine oxidoreductase SoxD
MKRRRVRPILMGAAALAGAGGLGLALVPGATLASAAAAVTAQLRTLSGPLPVASSEPIQAPLGVGRPATPEELAGLDTAIRPDGRGLPPGSGDAMVGEDVYRIHCASCHGPDGGGTPAGWPLVGRNPDDAFDFNESLEQELRRTVGNYWPYATTLFDYTRRAMPMDRPGSLSNAEVYAVTAWMLWRNGIVPVDRVLDAITLPQVRMPAAGRFVPDDRR